MCYGGNQGQSRGARGSPGGFFGGYPRAHLRYVPRGAILNLKSGFGFVVRRRSVSVERTWLRCEPVKDFSTLYPTLNMPLIMPASLDTSSPAQSPSASTAAAGASSPSHALQPQQLSIPLPLSPHTTLHIQITPLEKSTMVFLTTTDPSSSSSLSALGSFVYSMPNVPFPRLLPDLSFSTKITDKACHSSDYSPLNP